MYISGVGVQIFLFHLELAFRNSVFLMLHLFHLCYQIYILKLLFLYSLMVNMSCVSSSSYCSGNMGFSYIFFIGLSNVYHLYDLYLFIYLVSWLVCVITCIHMCGWELACLDTIMEVRGNLTIMCFCLILCELQE